MCIIDKDMEKKKFTFDEKDIIQNGLLAALYVVLTYIMAPISFWAIQFRLSEILVLACFFDKKKIVGLTLGCFLSNLVSPLGLIDLGFGTLATFLACLGIIFSKHLIVAIIFPVIFNGIIVGLELYLIGEPLWFSIGMVALGELGVMVVGYVILMLIKKNKGFFKVVRATQNIDFKF